MKNIIIALTMGMCLALGTPPAGASGPERQAGSDYGQTRQEFYGTIRSMPAGEIGIWDIDGRQVEVTRATRIEEEHGRAEEGAMVEVKGVVSGDSTFTAHKIEVKRTSR